MARKRKRVTSSSRLALLPIIERFQGTPIAVIGDLILDHYVWGKVNRISPEAPVVVVRVTEENKRLGGAGNVVNNLVTLGAKVKVCGVVGDDEAGRDLTRLLLECGADVSGVMVDPGRSTTVKTRVIAHAQQVVRVDRENTGPVQGDIEQGIAQALIRHLDSVKGIIVSDYAKGVITKNVLAPLSQARDRFGYQKVPLIIDPKAPNYSLYDYATVIKPNRREAEEAIHEEIGSRARAVAVGDKLIEKWNSDMVLMTLGEEGMVLLSRLPEVGKVTEIDTVARQVYDVSGAGDTVSAVFALALAAGAHPKEAAELANYGAGIVVAQVGTATVSVADLAETIGGE